MAPLRSGTEGDNEDKSLTFWLLGVLTQPGTCFSPHRRYDSLDVKCTFEGGKRLTIFSFRSHF